MRVVVDVAADAWAALAADSEDATVRRWPGAPVHHGLRSGTAKVMRPGRGLLFSAESSQALESMGDSPPPPICFE